MDTLPVALSDEVHAIIAEQAAAEISMTSLICMHYNEFKFDLYLRHKPTGFFPTIQCLRVSTRYAMCYSAGVHSKTVEFLYNDFVAQAPWLANYNMEDFEVYSKIGV